MQEVIYAILFVEAEILGLFIILWAIGTIWAWVEKKLNPHYPYCDIDPRCHIAFAWNKDGNGWIGKHLVVPNVQIEARPAFGASLSNAGLGPAKGEK